MESELGHPDQTITGVSRVDWMLGWLLGFLGIFLMCVPSVLIFFRYRDRWPRFCAGLWAGLLCLLGVFTATFFYLTYLAGSHHH